MADLHFLAFRDIKLGSASVVLFTGVELLERKVPHPNTTEQDLSNLSPFTYLPGNYLSLTRSLLASGLKGKKLASKLLLSFSWTKSSVPYLFHIAGLLEFGQNCIVLVYILLSFLSRFVFRSLVFSFLIVWAPD